MAEHTPGPWQARFLYRMIQAARRDPGLLTEAKPECDWADATLMAAAPELLAALREVSNAYGCFAGCTASLPNPQARDRKHTLACARARAAIAKARAAAGSEGSRP